MGIVVAGMDTAVVWVATGTVAVLALDTAGVPLEFHTAAEGTEAGTAVVSAPDSGDIAIQTAGWYP
ncbi:MAG: hypothetical protein ACLQUY_15020 [Ktedonobacterales bacterium]